MTPSSSTPDLPTETNPCIQMLSAFASLETTSIGSRARAFELSLAKPVTCVASPEELPEPERSALLKALKAHKPKQNLCHDNAWRVCAFERHPFSLVTGYACSLIPMEHSWLRIEAAGRSFDFDPTDWAVFGGGKFTHHIQIACMDPDEASRRAVETGHSGSWRQEIIFEALGIEHPLARAHAKREAPQPKVSRKNAMTP